MRRRAHAGRPQRATLRCGCSSQRGSGARPASLPGSSGWQRHAARPGTTPASTMPPRPALTWPWVPAAHCNCGSRGTFPPLRHSAMRARPAPRAAWLGWAEPPPRRTRSLARAWCILCASRTKMGLFEPAWAALVEAQQLREMQGSRFLVALGRVAANAGKEALSQEAAAEVPRDRPASNHFPPSSPIPTQGCAVVRGGAGRSAGTCWSRARQGVPAAGPVLRAPSQRRNRAHAAYAGPGRGGGGRRHCRHGAAAAAAARGTRGRGCLRGSTRRLGGAVGRGPGSASDRRRACTLRSCARGARRGPASRFGARGRAAMSPPLLRAPRRHAA